MGGSSGKELALHSTAGGGGVACLPPPRPPPPPPPAPPPFQSTVMTASRMLPTSGPVALVRLPLMGSQVGGTWAVQAVHRQRYAHMLLAQMLLAQRLLDASAAQAPGAVAEGRGPCNWQLEVLRVFNQLQAMSFRQWLVLWRRASCMEADSMGAAAARSLTCHTVKRRST